MGLFLSGCVLDCLYGSACSATSDCQLGFACLAAKCSCDNSYVYDISEKVCKKICRGSKERFVKHGSVDHQYNILKTRYTNCSYVDGSLEITNLEGVYDLGFLKDIEEVTGYVLVVNVYSNYLNLTKLRIIRGQELFEYQEHTYSLYVALNHNPHNDSQGLLELQFNNLSEIVQGHVYFKNNNLLCFANTIRWDDINPSSTPSVKFEFESANYKRQYPPCPGDCYNQHTGDFHCWDSRKNMCQKLNYVKEVCSESCDGRCFGDQQNQCCHPECAAGCKGPRKSQCLACRNFYNDGECNQFCPKMTIYDQRQMKWVQNKDGRYSFGSLCVKDCPSYLVKDNDACVIKCPDGKMPNPDTNICDACDGACPKECPGMTNNEFLHSENLPNFTGCTIVDGNLRILKVSFTGDPHMGTRGISPDDLNILENIREITGYLSIQEAPPEVKNLSFLSGLETINGRYTTSTQHSLNLLRMEIEYLGLMSLRHIRNGNVVVGLNPNLCYTQGINMSLLFSRPEQKYQPFRNRNETECEKDGFKCDAQCSRHGCWGPGPNKCLKCKSKRVEHDNTCLASCTDQPLLYETVNKTCKQCHSQCAVGCNGPLPSNCTDCKKVKVPGPKSSFTCMEECLRSNDVFQYPDSDRFCRSCDRSCAEGCTGPSNAVKFGGCMSCNLAIDGTHLNDTVRCLPKQQNVCPDGYYQQLSESPPLDGKMVCHPCHPLCLTCNARGPSNCPKCRHLRLQSAERNSHQCMDQCPKYFWQNDTECLPCHDQCYSSCIGANETDCDNCKKFKIILDDSKFSCVDQCPEHLPHLVDDTDPDKPTKTVCAGDDHPVVMAERDRSKDAERKKILSIALPAAGGVIILGILLTLFGYYWRQRERAKENTIKLTARMTGVVDTEPLTPTDAKPDLSKLRLIRESELRRGGIIGSGAFGTVYKGFWIPENENVKIPVAIKVLQEGTSPNQNQELLEEARVMASVEHPCCIRILAVCMASQMMLITQLMPLGCLLDYIRKHKDNTGSKALLNWCTQIARGMAYLEERGIVHRDLAARNVLVQSAGQVKITDFGLAKLLDYNEEQYHASGGKMPIKWLALECIKNRVFTHKSDVWSYGVTVWELFTYGNRPYENVRAKDVPDLLEKGERLPQPPMCTIDVYMIMIKCWMLDAESRPSFIELAEEFAKMARDPGRYLVIQGDELKKIPSEEVLDGPKIENMDNETAEGDKLLRLPSYSYDKDDLARHLSVAAEDGPEEVMEADDYLQPAQHAPPIPMEPENNNSKQPLLSPGACKEPRREKRYGHLESAAAARQQRDMSPSNRLRGDSINGRYSSDPVKYTRGRDHVDGPFMGPVKMPPMGNGNPYNYNSYIRQPETVPFMQPILDEDDYLQPKSANPKAYLDLENSKDYYLNEKQMSQPNDPLDNYPPPAPSLFDNPEYFEGDNVFNAKSVPRQNSDPRHNVDTRRSMNKPKIAPKPRRLTDYYNDIGNNPHALADGQRLLSNSSNCSNGESTV